MAAFNEGLASEPPIKLPFSSYTHYTFEVFEGVLFLSGSLWFLINSVQFENQKTRLQWISPQKEHIQEYLQSCTKT